MFSAADFSCMEIRKEDPKMERLRKTESLDVKSIKENSQAELKELPWRLPFCLKGDAVLKQLFAEFYTSKLLNAVQAGCI